MQQTSQCKDDISHASKTAKIIVFDPMMCKKPRYALTRRAVALIICSLFDMWPTWIASIEAWLVFSRLVHVSSSL